MQKGRINICSLILGIVGLFYATIVLGQDCVDNPVRIMPGMNHIQVITGENFGFPFISGGTGSYHYPMADLPSNVELSAEGKIHGKIDHPGSYTFDVTASDGNCSDQMQGVIIACPAISFPGIPDDAKVGEEYSASVQESGITFSIIGTLPAGLVFENGIISGKPTQSGSFDFNLEARTDAISDCPAELKMYVIHVACTDIDLSGLNSSGIPIGEEYSETIQVTGGGGSYSYIVSSGTLPPGLTLNINSGEITGVPDYPGTYPFTITVKDIDNNCSNCRHYTLKIDCPFIAMTPAELPDGTVNTPYSVDFNASGGNLTYDYQLSGTLPSGLSISGNVISGTPQMKEKKTIEITASQAGCTFVKEYTINISDCELILSDLSPSTATVGETYTSDALSATGGTGPYTFSSEDTWPTGWSINNGVITGTPSSSGTITLKVRATDQAGCYAVKDYTVTAGCGTITLGDLSPSTATVGVAYTSNALSASGGTSPYTFSSEGAWPTGWSINNGVITGTPSSSGTITLKVRATDQAGCYAVKDYTVTAGCGTITLGDLSPSTATVGVAYTSNALSASGGTSPYTFSSEGAWPTGWSINNGVITGTPSSSGTITLKVRATDQVGCYAVKDYTVTAGCGTITLGDLSPSTATVGVAYTSNALSASGGTSPYTFSSEGAWPTGWSINNGIITGTPSSSGTITLKVRATDQAGCYAVKDYTVTAGCGTITLGDLSPSTATVGVAYTSNALSASGGTSPYTFSSEGAWPTGWSINNGVITGTPSSSGTITLKVRATDQAGCYAVKDYMLSAGCGVITLNDLSPASATVGVPYQSDALTATGGSGTYTFNGEDTWPSGWTINTNGVIAGTVNAPGVITLKVRATDTKGCFGMRSYNISSDCVPITGGSLNNNSAKVGVPYSGTISGLTGGSGYYQISVIEGMPTGLSLTGNTISGTPQKIGLYTIKVSVTDRNNPSCPGIEKSFNLNVSCGDIIFPKTDLPEGVYNVTYSATIDAATGGSGSFSYELKGSLPSGLVFDASARKISGVPASSPNTYSFEIIAKDINNATCFLTQSYMIIIGCGNIRLNELPNLTARLGETYSVSLSATGGKDSYTFSKSGSEPAWLSVKNNVLSGIPKDKTGAVNVTLRAEDAFGCPATRNYTINVECGSIILPVTTLAKGNIGKEYISQISPATGSSGSFEYIVDTSTPLPDGLQFNPSTLVISGNPTKKGITSFRIIARDANNPGCTQTQTYSITIDCGEISLGSINTSANYNIWYSSTIQASGGVSPYTFSLTKGNLPSGLSLSPNGVISGAPVSDGASFTVSASDRQGCTGQRDYEIRVGCKAGNLFPTSLVAGNYGDTYSQQFTVTPSSAKDVYSMTGTVPGLVLSTDGKLSGKPTQAGIFSIGIVITDINNCSTSQIYTLTINKAEVSVEPDANQSRKYKESNPVISYKLTGVKFTADETELRRVVALTTDATVNSPVGTYNITLPATNHNNYTIKLVDNPNKFAVTKADQTIDFPVLASHVYGDAGFKLNASASSGNKVVYVSKNTNVARISDDIVTIINAGEAVIEASQSGDSNYNTAPVKSQRLTVGKAVLTVKAENTSREYGAANPEFNYSCSGWKNGDNISVLNPKPEAITTAGLTTGVGAYDIKFVTSENKNYEYSFIQGTLTITKAPLVLKADDKTRLPNTINPALTYTCAGLKNGEKAESVLSPEPSVTTTAKKESPAGDYPIEISGGKAVNYSIVQYLEGTLTITGKPVITVTVANARKEYGDENPGFSISYSGFIDGDNENSLNVKPTARTSATKESAVGVYNIEISGGSDDKYVFAYNNARLDITQASLTVSIANKQRVYGQANPEFTFNYSGWKNNDNENALDQKPVATCAAVKESDAGNYNILLKECGKSNNYKVSCLSTPGILTITKADQVIDFSTITPNPVAYARDAVINLAATTPAGSGITFASSNNSIAVVSGTKLTIKGVGNVNITAKHSGNKNYNAAQDVVQSLTIEEASQEITFNPLPGNKKFGDAPFTISATSSSGLSVTFESSDHNIASVEGNKVTIHNAGSVTITARQAGNQYYQPAEKVRNLVIAKASQHITYTSPGNQRYGSPPIRMADLAQVNSGLPLTFSTSNANVAVVDGSALRFVGVGEATVYVQQITGSSNYLPTENIPISFIVDRAPLTIKADNKFKQQGKANPSFTFTCSGFVNGEDESVLTKTPVLTTVADEKSSVGKYTISFKEQATASNYTISHQTGVLEIVSKEVVYVSVTPVTRRYGENNPGKYQLTYKDLEGKTLDIKPDVEPDVTCKADKNSPAGIYTINITGGQDSRYEFSYTPGTLTVTKVRLTATADNKTRLYGQLNPAFTISYTGFVNGDGASVIDEEPLASSEAQPDTPVGGVRITLAGGSDDCYDFAYVDGWLTILSASVDLKLDNLPIRTYGDAPFVLPINVDGVPLADLKVTVTPDDPAQPVMRADYSDEQGKWIVTVLSSGTAGIRVVFDGDDYRTPSSASASQIVQKATLVAKADDKEKIYGDPNPDWTISYSGFVGDDQLADIDQLSVASCNVQVGSVVGAYPIVVTGGYDNDYIFDHQQGTLQVTPADQLPTAFTPNGDGINDIFAEGYKVKVFNRLGTLLYNGSEYIGWDGTYKGKQVLPDVYFYIATSPQGTVRKGSIEIIKNN